MIDVCGFLRRMNSSFKVKGEEKNVRIPEEYHEADNLTVMSLLVSSGLTFQCLILMPFLCFVVIRLILWELIGVSRLHTLFLKLLLKV